MERHKVELHRQLELVLADMEAERMRLEDTEKQHRRWHMAAEMEVEQRAQYT